MLVKTINRRQLNHALGRVLDQILESGEAVRVTGRDGRSVVISADRSESVFDGWVRSGQVEGATVPASAFLTLEPLHLNQDTVDRVLADLEEDR